MKIFFISLGCDKNLVDSEEMIGLLTANGHSITNNEAEAEAIIINTCCFIHDAKEESIQSILEMARFKTDGVCKKLIVCGCLSTRYKDEILEEIPEIDVIMGTSSIDRVLEAIEEDDRVYMDKLERLPIVKADRISVTGGWYEYLKIAEGCSKNCTYCIIPKVRGPYRSYPAEYVYERAKDLVAAGAKEIVLVAQEVTAYGTDMPGRKKLLTKLIKGLAMISGLKWIRLLYCYPEEITDDLIYLMKNEPKLLHYIDMPIQHASDPILKAMGRKTDKKSIEKIIEKLRREIPDICIRTTLISGFPGETDYDHDVLKDFVKYNRFDRLGVFEYSEEEGTPAAGFSHKVDPGVIFTRRNEIMELQQEISAGISKSMIGKTMELIVDGYLPEDDVYVCRSYRDAPDVDGQVFVAPGDILGRDIVSGTFIKARITQATEYDLMGEAVM